MPRKPPDEEVIRQREAMRQRMQYLLDNHWSGNQHRMARDLEVSQGLISKLVNGHQGAGRDFLALLANQPGISREWVLSGAGQPFLPPTKGTLPIAIGILPGWPARHPEKMTGQRHPVADALEKPSRYWVRVAEESPLLWVPDLALLVGDLLMFDADLALWTGNLDGCIGRLFGVRLEHVGRESFEFGRMARDSRGLFVDLFDGGFAAAAARKAFFSRYKRKKRRIQRETETSTEQPAEPGTPLGSPTPTSEGGASERQPGEQPIRRNLTIQLEDLVAMRVYSARP